MNRHHEITLSCVSDNILVAGAHSCVSDNILVAGAHVCVSDNNFTTGATLDEIASILKAPGSDKREKDSIRGASILLIDNILTTSATHKFAPATRTSRLTTQTCAGHQNLALDTTNLRRPLS